VLVALAGLVYLPTLESSFVWDDTALIVENKDLDAGLPVRFLGQSFTHWWASQGLVPHAYYRPLPMISFWLDHKVWGLKPAGFHLTNILLNIVAGLLVVILLKELAQGKDSLFPALLGGLAFMLHPMHVESVAFVSGRTDLMMTIFVLLAFLVLLRFRSRMTAVRVSKLTFALVPIAFAAGLLSKEAAILFPAIAAAVLAARRQGQERKRGHDAESCPLFPVSPFLMLVLLTAIAVAYLVVRSVVLQGVSVAWAGVTPVQRLLIVLNAFGRYVFLSLVPFPHRLAYPDMAVFAAPGWPTAIAVLALLGLGWLAAKYRRGPLGGELAHLGALWFLLFLLPACNFFPPGPSLLSERLLYLPSAGVVLMSVAAVLAIKSFKVRRALAILALIYIIPLAWSAVRWMPVWKSNRTLQATMAQENPRNAAIRANLASMMKDAGERSSAIAEYKAAIAAKSDSADLRLLLGKLLKESGDIGGAERELRRAAALKPDLAEAHHVLGGILLVRNDVAGAITEYRQSVKIAPDQALAHNNLGVALQQAGDVKAAEAEYRAALRLDPKLALAHVNLGETWMNAGRLDSAMVEFRQAIASQPDQALAHYDLGLVLQRLGRHDEAEKEYREVLLLAPDFNAAQEGLEQLGK
jgi:Flp pilus assembly protein TadD